ncbi:hypothetical protein OKW42_002900 [Paraburkholderia sp. WC7.3d]
MTASIDRSHRQREMQRGRPVQRDRSRRAAPEPQRYNETTSGKFERPDSECVIEQMEKEIDQQHHAGAELHPAQRGLYPQRHANVPLVTCIV